MCQQWNIIDSELQTYFELYFKACQHFIVVYRDMGSGRDSQDES